MIICWKNKWTSLGCSIIQLTDDQLPRLLNILLKGILRVVQEQNRDIKDAACLTVISIYLMFPLPPTPKLTASLEYSFPIGNSPTYGRPSAKQYYSFKH